MSEPKELLDKWRAKVSENALDANLAAYNFFVELIARDINHFLKFEILCKTLISEAQARQLISAVESEMVFIKISRELVNEYLDRLRAMLN
jgi:hypothetical protein